MRCHTTGGSSAMHAALFSTGRTLRPDARSALYGSLHLWTQGCCHHSCNPLNMRAWQDRCTTETPKLEGVALVSQCEGRAFMAPARAHSRKNPHWVACTRLRSPPNDVDGHARVVERVQHAQVRQPTRSTPAQHQAHSLARHPPRHARHVLRSREQGARLPTLSWS